MRCPGCAARLPDRARSAARQVRQGARAADRTRARAGRPAARQSGVRHLASRCRPVRAACGPLLDLIPATGTGPLFLDPVTTSLAEGLQQVQRTPAGVVREELQRLFPAGPHSSWARLLAARDRQAWGDLQTAQHQAYRDLVGGQIIRARHAYQAELAWRSTMIAKTGIQAFLSALHPSVSWDGTVLQISTTSEWDMHPDGKGLTLMPSLYWTGRPTLTLHSDGSAVIIYAALTPLPLIDQPDGDPLASLLGRTRAACCARRSPGRPPPAWPVPCGSASLPRPRTPERCARPG
jgi:hypothetical protein